MSFRPTDDDEKLWKFVTRGAKKFLNDHSKDGDKKSDVSQKKYTEKKFKADIALSPFYQNKNKQPTQPPQLNRRDAERLRKGQIEIEAMLDLHGLTQEQARQNLDLFINRSLNKGFRCLLVITGKGSISKPSVLKQNLPEWLEMAAYASSILKVTPAQPKHGGSGAFYIYLKRS